MTRQYSGLKHKDHFLQIYIHKNNNYREPPKHNYRLNKPQKMFFELELGRCTRRSSCKTLNNSVMPAWYIVICLCALSLNSSTLVLPYNHRTYRHRSKLWLYNYRKTVFLYIYSNLKKWLTNLPTFQPYRLT